MTEEIKIPENLVKKYLDSLVIRIEVRNGADSDAKKEFVKVYGLYCKNYDLSEYESRAKEISERYNNVSLG